MKYFLTGASGYVGSVIAEKLQARGDAVLGLARSDEASAKLKARGIETLGGDLHDTDALIEGAQNSDGVIHTAFIHDFADFDKSIATDIRAIEAITDALKGTNKPFVASSATGVLGDTGGYVATEETPTVDESVTFLAKRARSERATLNATTKGVRSSLIRICFNVYGRGGSLFVPVMIDVAKRNHGVARYVGAGEYKWSTVHVNDLADLFILAAEKAPAGTLLHGASNDVGVSTKELATSISRMLGQEGKTESVPREKASEVFGGIAAFMQLSSQTSGQKARKLLGWNPAQPSVLEEIERGSYRAAFSQ